DQGHDHAGFGDVDEVALDVEPAGDGAPRGRVGVCVDAKLAHGLSAALNARTWSPARPSRAMRSLYAAMASRFSSSHFLRLQARTSAHSAFSSVADRLMSSARAASSRPSLMLRLVARLP